MRSRIAVLAAGMLALATPVAAEPATSPPLISWQALDALLESGRYDELNAAMASDIRKPGGIRNIHEWQKSHVFFRGAGTFVVMHHVQLLWAGGQRYSQTVVGDSMQEAAGTFALLALQMIALDGLKCADQSAPGRRQDQFVALARPALKHLASLPDDKRQKAISISIQYEKRSEAIRRNDDFLCRGGLEELGHAMQETGMMDKAVTPGPKGSREIVLPPPRSYQPKFLDAKDWKDKQAALREGMRDRLSKMLDVFR